MKPPFPFPGEVWSLIVLFSDNPSAMGKTCVYLKDLVNSPYTIASWILFRYTNEYSFMGAANWWIKKSKFKSKSFKHRCRSSLDVCDFEKRQIQVAQYLLAMGMHISAFEEYVLKEAAAIGHLKYAEWILSMYEKIQIDKLHYSSLDLGIKFDIDSARITPKIPNEESVELISDDSTLFRNNLLCESLMQENYEIIQILISHRSSNLKSLQVAVDSKVKIEIIELMLQHVKPTITILQTCMIKACTYRWVPFCKNYLSREIKIVCLLIDKYDFSTDVNNEDRHRLVMNCAELGSVDVMKKLIANGCNLYHETGNAIFTSALLGNYKLFKTILNYNDGYVTNATTDGVRIRLQDIFNAPRIALLIICCLDHIVVLYGLLASSLGLIMSLACFLRESGICSRLNGFEIIWDNQIDVCIYSYSDELLLRGAHRILAQQTLGFVCCLGLCLILNCVLPFLGILQSLIFLLRKSGKSKEFRIGVSA